MKVLKIALLTLVAIAGPSVSVAATIFAQTPTLVAGVASDKDFPGSPTGQRYIADDFVVATSETLHSITWQGQYYSDNTPLVVDDFTISIFSDSAGSPGALLETVSAGNDVYRTLTGDQVTYGSTSYDNYQYSANLDAGFSLNAGETYWISIQNDSSATTSGWYWMYGDSVSSNSQYSANANIGSWSTITAGYDQYMVLSNTVVPIPAAAWLFGSALIGLGWVRRRQTA